MEKQTNIFDVLEYPDDWTASDALKCACVCVCDTDYEPQDGQGVNQSGNRTQNQQAANDAIPVLPGQLVWCRSLHH